MNLDWINEFINELPEISSERKNLIEIAGYPKRENVNSNLLAFYFDEYEEHGFGRLFFNSLVDLYESKTDIKIERELFETEFTVDREVSTKNGGFIDIVIKEGSSELDASEPSSWAIIIENKLFSDLHNNLIDYWKSTKSDVKYGLVLSVSPVPKDRLVNKRVKYINILHSELVEKVKQNLPEYYLESNDLHLLFLKEYITNVKSYYRDNLKIKEMDTALQLFHENKANIEEFKKKDMDLLKHISTVVFDIMEEMGFPPYSRKKTSKTKHFQVQEDSLHLSETIIENIEIAKKFRFFVDLGTLRYNNTFEAVFELYGNKNTVYGDKLKSNLEQLGLFAEHVKKGEGGKSGSGYQHILHILIPIGDFSTEGFGVKLREVLQSELFDKLIIDKIILELRKIIDKEKNAM